MKNETISAFKKVLSTINTDEIDYEKSIERLFGGWINISFDNFLLTMFIGKCHLRYKSIGIELTIGEWKELKELVDNKLYIDHISEINEINS